MHAEHLVGFHLQPMSRFYAAIDELSLELLALPIPGKHKSRKKLVTLPTAHG